MNAPAPTSKPAAPQLPPPPKAPAPPPKQGNGQKPQTPTRDFAVSKGRVAGPQRVLIYGTGGIGKSSLAGLAPSPVFLDIEGGTNELDVPRIAGIETFAELRSVITGQALEPFGTVILDTATKGEELATAHTLATVPHEKGHFVDRLESYGFGKGLAHVYETFMLLLQDFDSLVRKGKNVILIAHDCISDVPNPVGDDFIRYEPHLQSPKSGKNSVRNRIVQWADHVLFIGYDVVSRDGKGKGGGTRTIWTNERPDHIAKVRGRTERGVPDSLPYELGDSSIWSMILGGMS